jgi:predicted nucleic acid-binding protein
MKLIVDASIVIKWFVMENLHDEARQLIVQGHSLHAPDFIVVEIANIVWKKALRKEIDEHQAAAIVAASLAGAPVRHSATEFVGRGIEIALDLGHPVYDCIYIACAEELESIFVTADTRLENAVRATKFSSRVVHLAGFDGSPIPP